LSTALALTNQLELATYAADIGAAEFSKNLMKSLFDSIQPLINETSAQTLKGRTKGRRRDNAGGKKLRRKHGTSTSKDIGGRQCLKVAKMEALR
jgi:hypothetical protein